MNQTDVPVQSLKTLIISMISAVFLAFVILVTVVGPAEFGIDPTGLGKTMGLTALAPPQPEVLAKVSCPEPDAVLDVKPEEETTAPVLSPIRETRLDTLISNELSQADSQSIAALPTPKPKPKPKSSTGWKDVVVITVPPASGLEYKFNVNKKAELAYSWATDGAKLYFDFHGEPAGDTTGYFKSFKATTDKQSDGILKAPFTGSHGWYWENKTQSPIKVTLKTKGQYKIKGLMR